jgi:coatomer subunit alpha
MDRTRWNNSDGPDAALLHPPSVIRGLDWHWQEPLLVSGGDNGAVQLWDSSTFTFCFALCGHTAPVTSVHFHCNVTDAKPWIVSASHDQSIRIWDYSATSRSCLAVVTGHGDAVTSARFQPTTEHLIVSSSLDATVRVWDYTGLCQPRAKPEAEADCFSALLFGSKGWGFLASNAVVVKYILEGHTAGVLSASFHPTLPLLVSSAMDGEVKLWRLAETKAWEVDTLGSHQGPVTDCFYHPQEDIIVSCSEDGSIRIWSAAKRVEDKSRALHDRVCLDCMVAHPKLDLLAAGGNKGLVVFELDKGRAKDAIK